jgi:hypothetical protein
MEPEVKMSETAKRYEQLAFILQSAVLAALSAFMPLFNRLASENIYIPGV